MALIKNLTIACLFSVLILLLGCIGANQPLQNQTNITQNVSNTNNSTGVSQNSTPSELPTIQITIQPEVKGYTIPSDFLGLSYEDPVLATDDFDPANQTFVNMLENLGNGTLRFGANSVEWTYWSRVPVNLTTFIPQSDLEHRESYANKSGISVPNSTVLYPSDLDRVFAFANRTGWHVIFGANLATDNPQMAADESAYAYQVGNRSILAFEIGNEPDLFPVNGLRSPNYSYSDYQAEYDAYVAAIKSRVPDAPISGPATAGYHGIGENWFSDFVSNESSAIILSTTHYYSLDDPDNQTAVEDLLSRQTAEHSNNTVAKYMSSSLGIPLRFAETNMATHLKGNILNNFASALWGADYLFTLAENGVVGANFHNGLFTNCYGQAPICFDNSGNYHVQPLYYGMLLFHYAAKDGHTVSAYTNSSLNIDAYAVIGKDNRLRLVIINKEPSQDANFTIDGVGDYTSATAVRLVAPSLYSTDGETFAGSSVNPDGTWSVQKTEDLSKTDKEFQIVVPASSAAVVTFER